MSVIDTSTTHDNPRIATLRESQLTQVMNVKMHRIHLMLIVDVIQMNLMTVVHPRKKMSVKNCDIA
jgi:hypothetical protein